MFTAAETFRRIQPFLADFGVTRLARLTGLDSIGLPVWNAISPNSRSIVINQGKGITDTEAKLSAAMEAIERAAAGMPTVKTIETSMSALGAQGRAATALPGLIAAGQPDVGTDERIAWARGFDLIQGIETWVPFDALLLDRTIDDCRFWQSSDGLASGNTPDEAILHGLMERIERDAEVLWRITPFHTRIRGCLDPRTLGNPDLDVLVERIEAAALTLRLFEMTSDIGLPCFTALMAPAGILSAKASLFVEVTLGNGAHVDGRRAALRAVTEAVQSRLTYISGARDDVFPETFTRPLPAEIRRHFEAKPVHQHRTDPETPPAGVAETMRVVLARLQRAGIRSAVAVLISADHLPFSVAKVFVPQLENPDGARKRRFGTRAISKAMAA